MFDLINRDLTCSKEALQMSKKDKWLEAIRCELKSMEENEVCDILDIPTHSLHREEPNVLRSRWVFKRKNDLYKTGLVIRGDQDKNEYELEEIYAPVSRLELVRTVCNN